MEIFLKRDQFRKETVLEKKILKKIFWKKKIKNNFSYMQI